MQALAGPKISMQPFGWFRDSLHQDRLCHDQAIVIQPLGIA